MVFTNNAAFANVFERLAAWATYHNETFNGSTFASNANGTLVVIDANSGAMLAVIIVSSVAMLALLVAFVTLKRKHKAY